MQRDDPSALTVRDLLDARDAYHCHLVHMDHVVATAVGRYLIRDSDPDSDESKAPLAHPGAAVRTLSNSSVKRSSWPCVLVFVDRWATPGEMASRPDQYVPPWLYLPDGRIIPTCVVYGAPSPDRREPIIDIQASPHILGGGYPLLSDVQGELRIGTIGCLVTDGHSTFALTNRHVAGHTGQVSYAFDQDDRVRVGEAVATNVKTLAFEKAYPGWSGPYSELKLDAGLVRLDDVSLWTSQVYGIGSMGPMLDLSRETIVLDLVDQQVKAFGGVSGPLQGRIRGLFYRYTSRAGIDYLTDFLIAPDPIDEQNRARPGDSGTLWFLDERDKDGTRLAVRPFAMQWGGHVLSSGDGDDAMQLHLASSLSVICRALDVELLTDWETGLSPFWGKIGHFKVGAKACDVVANAKLYRLMQANQTRIGLSDDELRRRDLPRTSTSGFVALADVPDIVWKRRSGTGSRGSDENPTHYADADQKATEGSYRHESLMSLYLDDPATLDIDIWKKFYGDLSVPDRYRGTLPFRVRQFYEEMVDAVQARDIPRFVGAAGILSHYVGDACQPLHGSYLHNGRPNVDADKGVHTKYETTMIDRYRVEILTGVNDALDGYEIGFTIRGGQAAAELTMDLMNLVQNRLPPRRIIDTYRKRTGRQRIPYMWDKLGQQTIENLADGSLYLAILWESAWLEGDGSQIPNTNLIRQSTTRMRRLYNRKNFVKSMWLRDWVW